MLCTFGQYHNVYIKVDNVMAVHVCVDICYDSHLMRLSLKIAFLRTHQ